MTQSAESLENKRVEFLMGAKKCKRVRKNMKRKNLNMVARDEWCGVSSRMGRVGIHPAVFVPQNRQGCKSRIRVANKGVAGYGEWKSA